MRVFGRFVLLSAALLSSAQAVEESSRPANGLIHQTSPYLLQHAHNPVDWMPWGEAAIQRAQREQKPIFLSVGYSTCYWCHVMEREVFEDAEIAEQLNQQFVCVKVDREERPDIDGVYMVATQIMTRSGGWPMNVFLTPPAPAGQDQSKGYGLKPYFCTTYLPPQPKEGLPSFPMVSNRMHMLWETQREKVLDQAERLAGAVVQVMSDSQKSGPLDKSTARMASKLILKQYDAVHGGFSTAKQGPKFPQPARLALLLAQSQLDPQAGETAGQAVLHTLDAMAQGGMFDQAGGGFHRYSTDQQWLVPHFEKMLYDNGQLLSVYARAIEWQRTVGQESSARTARYERVLREMANYLLSEMTDDSGAFWSAQDAEVDGHEGGNYLWTAEQIRQALGDPAQQALGLRMYGLDRGTNFTDPHAADAKPVNVLYLPESLESLAQALEISLPQLSQQREVINTKLMAIRSQRKQPAVDDKVIVAWNGLAIQGLAEAAEVLDAPNYADAAKQAAAAILQHMSQPNGSLARTMRKGQPQGSALLADYTHLSAGLLALAQATGEQQWLKHAKQLTQYAIDHFAADSGGYFDTLPDQTDLFVRVLTTFDDALPSGNSQMVQNLVALHNATGEQLWLDRAVADLRSVSAKLSDQGESMPGMVQAFWQAMQHARAEEQLAAP